MKPDITPSNRRHQLQPGDFIVSKTDLKGRITYCNRIFMDISGYQEHELLGQQHNIIRHPDMPRAVFHMMWETLQSGSEFFGYVKNLRKDGGYYWVFANITPTPDHQGRTMGYYSVRRSPREQAISVIEPIYREMLEAERQAGPKEAIAASTKLLQHRLNELNTDYEHFVLSL